VPGGGVHAEMLKMREIDDDGTVLATDAEIGIAMATTTRLNLEPLIRGALHNRGDLISAPRPCDRGGGDSEGCIVWFYSGELVEWVFGQREVCAACERIGEAGFQRGRGGVAHRVSRNERLEVGVEETRRRKPGAGGGLLRARS
jgi:hypothetical protein